MQEEGIILSCNVCMIGQWVDKDIFEKLDLSITKSVIMTFCRIPM